MSESDSNKVLASSGKTEIARQGWAPFDSLRREIDRIFDDFRPLGSHWPRARTEFPPDLAGMVGPGTMAPAMDLVEKDDRYEIAAELPGIDEENVEVKVANRTLTIKGEKKEEREEKDKGYVLSERRFGSFQRSLRLPDDIDLDRIEANFAKGVLTVTMPKTAEARQPEKKISIKSG